MRTVRERIGNRRFAGAQPTMIIGPVEVPDGVEGVRRTLRRFAAEGPQTRVGLVPDRARSAWRFDVDCTVLPVDERPEPDPLDVAAELVRIGDLPPAPLRVEVAGDYLILSYDHGLGDGVFFVEVAAALTRPTPSGFPGLRRDGPTRVTRQPLARALVSEIRSHPRAVTSALAALARTTFAGETPPAAAIRVTPDARSTVEFASSSAGYLTRIREYRDRAHPGASMVAVVAFRIRTALRDAGVPVRDDVQFMVNLRRYLPHHTTVANFIGATTASTRSPAETTAELRATLRGSDIVVHQAGADLLARLRPGRLDQPHLFREIDDPGVTLVISDLTPHPATDTIAWKQDTDKKRVFAVVSASRTTNQLNVVLNRMDDELHVTACFVDGAFDPAVVHGALVAALADPPVSA